VDLNHSSDIKTMQEIFGLGPNYLNNAIPSSEYSISGGPGTYNTVAGSNDLSDLFKPGVIPTGVPEPSTLAVFSVVGALALCRRRRAGETKRHGGGLRREKEEHAQN
jgi:hypothetical protein